ncbi:hypothetical protein BLOT_016598 [Blomia tropicalis]|nr:hypothetical protein BLOT_016598 [Blomia tropicalis]
MLKFETFHASHNGWIDDATLNRTLICAKHSSASVRHAIDVGTKKNNCSINAEKFSNVSKIDPLN